MENSLLVSNRLQGNIKNRLQSKNVLIEQGREAPHFLIRLSSVYEKKVGLEAL